MHVMPETLRRIVSPLVVLLLVLTISPVRVLAETEPGTPIGSVSAVGSVRLRGVGLVREGTIFAGDSIRTGNEAYARLSLAGGQQIELGGATDVEVESTDTRVEIAMRSGSVAFASPDSSAGMSIGVASYEVVAQQGSTGEITFLDDGQVGVRSLEGSILLQSDVDFVEIPEGEGRLIPLAGAPGPPAPQATAQSSVADTVIWVTVVGATVAFVVTQLLTGGDPASPSNP